jgi:ribosomal protein L12E/L44/L45/RPP1/RPP2
MAEVQTSIQSGELSQRFIEFVMMQAQQASLFLGRLPHPQSGQSQVQLEPAKLFIDHLEMIREKTRGNLTTQEADILNSVLSDLQMAFVQASFQATSSASAEAATSSAQAGATPAPQEASKAQETTAEPAPETETKKKFSKSYGS